MDLCSSSEEAFGSTIVGSLSEDQRRDAFGHSKSKEIEREQFKHSFKQHEHFASNMMQFRQHASNSQLFLSVGMLKRACVMLIDVDCWLLGDRRYLRRLHCDMCVLHGEL